MKGQIILIEKPNKEILAVFRNLKAACNWVNISYNTVTSYFRRNPKAIFYTNKKSGLTLIKTYLQ